ncbi:MAG: hypothetical protein K1V84_10020 [Muribaculaceae bacterium]
MGGIELFICGGILLCNAVYVVHVVTSSKRKLDDKPGTPKDTTYPESKHETSQSEQEQKVESPDETGVAPSKFNMDEFMERIASEIVTDVKKQLPGLLSDIVGEMKLQDAEFVPDDEIERFTPAKVAAPLDPEEIQEAFYTDMRDIDDTPPAAPVASGSSIDELEQAVETAMNPKSTDEELAEAGKVIEPYRVTKMYDIITSNEEIDRRVELCFRLSIRSELSMRQTKPKKPTSAKSADPKEAKRALSIDLDNVDPDTFDVSEILKK